MSGSHLCIPRNETVISKTELYVLSPSSYTHISVRDLYISRIRLPILLQGNMWTDPVKKWISHRHMNEEKITLQKCIPEYNLNIKGNMRTHLFILFYHS